MIQSYTNPGINTDENKTIIGLKSIIQSVCVMSIRDENKTIIGLKCVFFPSVDDDLAGWK